VRLKGWRGILPAQIEDRARQPFASFPGGHQPK
jgi:hypothetical protein